MQIILFIFINLEFKISFLELIRYHNLMTCNAMINIDKYFLDFDAFWYKVCK